MCNYTPNRSLCSGWMESQKGKQPSEERNCIFHPNSAISLKQFYSFIRLFMQQLNGTYAAYDYIDMCILHHCYHYLSNIRLREYFTLW